VTTYEVQFLDWDGKLLKKEQVEEGKAATAPADPSREGYTFIGWDKDFSYVTSDLVVTAQYEANPVESHLVTFLDYNGIFISEQSVAHGEAAVAPDAPVHEGYIFLGWGQDITHITARTYAVAQYKADVPASGYSIVFKDGVDGEELGRANVDLTIPMIAYHEGYTFSGWEIEAGNVLLGITIVATYTDNSAAGVEEHRAEEANQKIIRDGQILIIRGEKTYTVTGQEIK
jgi:hypothetical protein